MLLKCFSMPHQTPTYVDTFLHASPICLLKFKCLSMVSPRNFIESDSQCHCLLHHFSPVCFYIWPETQPLKFFMIKHEFVVFTLV